MAERPPLISGTVPTTRRICYYSRATPGLTQGDVETILDRAVRRNMTLGVTGGLLFLDGWFVQVFEGAPAVVEEVWALIQRDRRHGDVIKVSDQIQRGRRFESAGMAQIDPAQIDPSIAARFGMPSPFDPRRMRANHLVRLVNWCCAGGHFLPPDASLG